MQLSVPRGTSANDGEGCLLLAGDGVMMSTMGWCGYAGGRLARATWYESMTAWYEDMVFKMARAAW